MTDFFVYTFLAAVMILSGFLAVSGAFALAAGGNTLWLTLLFTANTYLMGSCAHEYAKS